MDAKDAMLGQISPLLSDLQFILATRLPAQHMCEECLLWFWGTAVKIPAPRCACLLWRLPGLALGSGL